MATFVQSSGSEKVTFDGKKVKDKINLIYKIKDELLTTCCTEEPVTGQKIFQFNNKLYAFPYKSISYYYSYESVYEYDGYKWRASHRIPYTPDFANKSMNVVTSSTACSIRYIHNIVEYNNEIHMFVENGNGALPSVHLIYNPESGFRWVYYNGISTEMMYVTESSDGTRKSDITHEGIKISYEGYIYSYNSSTSTLYRYDGTMWNDVTSLLPDSFSISHWIVHDGLLHGFSDTKHYTFDGSNWTEIDNQYPASILSICSTSNGIYALMNNYHYSYANNIFKYFCYLYELKDNTWIPTNLNKPLSILSLKSGFEDSVTSYKDGIVYYSYTDSQYHYINLLGINNLNAEPGLPKKELFSDMCWEDISAVCKMGKASEYWCIGDKKPLQIGSTTYYVKIIDFDYDKVADINSYGRRTAGITLQLDGVLSEKYIMSEAFPTSDIGWSDSDLRLSILPDILSQFPEDLQQVIVSVKKSSQYISSASSDNDVSLTDDLFVLSYPEIKVNVYSSGTSIAAGESGSSDDGKGYEYYRQGFNKMSNVDTPYWLRSISYSSFPNFILNNGEFTNAVCNSEQYVSFAFCI